MTHGIMIVLGQTKLSESERRLFRKKRLQLMRRTHLKYNKKGVYLFPFESPEPSVDEVDELMQFIHLIHEFHVEANYFFVTQVKEPEDFISFGKELDPKKWKQYFVLKPTKILEK